MLGRGTYKFEVDGKTVGFKFGTKAAAVTEKVSGSAISEVFARIYQAGDFTTSALFDFFYGGAVSFSHPEITMDQLKAMTKEELKAIVPEEEVLEILDSQGVNELMKVFNQAIAPPKSPNGSAPNPEMEVGQSSTSQ